MTQRMMTRMSHDRNISFWPALLLPVLVFGSILDAWAMGSKAEHDADGIEQSHELLEPGDVELAQESVRQFIADFMLPIAAGEKALAPSGLRHVDVARLRLQLTGQSATDVTAVPVTWPIRRMSRPEGEAVQAFEVTAQDSRGVLLEALVACATTMPAAAPADAAASGATASVPVAPIPPIRRCVVREAASPREAQSPFGVTGDGEVIGLYQIAREERLDKQGRSKGISCDASKPGSPVGISCGYPVWVVRAGNRATLIAPQVFGQNMIVVGSAGLLPKCARELTREQLENKSVAALEVCGPEKASDGAYRASDDMLSLESPGGLMTQIMFGVSDFKHAVEISVSPTGDAVNVVNFSSGRLFWLFNVSTRNKWRLEPLELGRALPRR